MPNAGIHDWRRRAAGVRNPARIASLIIGNEDPPVIRPCATHGLVYPRQRDHLAVGDRDFFQVGIGKEGDPATIWRKERRVNSLRSGKARDVELVELAGVELRRRAAAGDVNNAIAIRRKSE